MKYYCPKCGNEVKEHETFCANCGNKNLNKKGVVKKKKSGIGIASLVISILSLITCGFSSIISLILGIIGVISSRKKNEKDGLALAGLIISTVQFVFVIGAVIFLLTAEKVNTIDYSSKSYAELSEYCKDINNSCHVREEYSDTIPEGEFIRQDPKAGELKYTFVDDVIYYSKGVEPTTTTTTAQSTQAATTTTTTTKATKATTTTTTKTTSVPLSGDINKTFSCPDYDITVIGYQIKKKGTRIDSFTVIGEPEWVAVFIKAQNKSDKEINISSYDFKFINHNGEVIEPSFLTYNIWGNYRLFKSPTLTKGGSSTGYLQFSNNDTNNNGLKFRIECDDWGIFKDETIHNLNLTN